MHRSREGRAANFGINGLTECLAVSRRWSQFQPPNKASLTPLETDRPQSVGFLASSSKRMITPSSHGRDISTAPGDSRPFPLQRTSRASGLTPGQLSFRQVELTRGGTRPMPCRRALSPSMDGHAPSGLYGSADGEYLTLTEVMEDPLWESELITGVFSRSYRLLDGTRSIPTEEALSEAEVLTQAKAHVASGESPRQPPSRGSASGCFLTDQQFTAQGTASPRRRPRHDRGLGDGGLGGGSRPAPGVSIRRQGHAPSKRMAGRLQPIAHQPACTHLLIAPARARKAQRGPAAQAMAQAMAQAQRPRLLERHILLQPPRPWTTDGPSHASASMDYTQRPTSSPRPPSQPSSRLVQSPRLGLEVAVNASVNGQAEPHNHLHVRAHHAHEASKMPPQAPAQSSTDDAAARPSQDLLGPPAVSRMPTSMPVAVKWV